MWSQTGPGGVGITDGISDLSLWLDANTITGLANNANMTGIWADQSGNGNNALIGRAPQYTTTGAGNGQPSLFFVWRVTPSSLHHSDLHHQKSYNDFVGTFVLIFLQSKS